MQEKRLKYPIGRQDFASIINEGNVYVDKTDLIYELVNSSTHIFLSRPGRFGKSLLLSTIRYYFEGRKDLFEGLKVSDLEKNWKKYPVFHFQLAGFNNDDHDSLKELIDHQFSNWEAEYQILNTSKDFSVRFREIIRNANRQSGEKVVILIDEYDNPLINSMENLPVYNQNRSLLKSIYSSIKDMDEYIRFVMMTGVSRFSNTTIFSGLNNLQDITFNDKYSCICGFKESEIRKYLLSGVEELAEKNNRDLDYIFTELKKEYDGYHFSEKLIDIYNPFSLLNCLAESKISNYWFRSGVPQFLVKRLEETNDSFVKIFNSQADEYELSAEDTSFTNPIALLFQTGYLTIKEYDPENQEYRLKIPNREVDRGLFLFLLGAYSNSRGSDGNRILKSLARFLENGKTDDFLTHLHSLIASVAFHQKGKFTELDFEKEMYIILHILGFHVHSELSTPSGRIDLFVETKDYIYIMELKLDKEPEEALKQIEDKKYSLPWRIDERKVIKVGIEFSSKTRNIKAWKIAE